MDLSPIIALIPAKDMLYVTAVGGVASAVAACMPPPGTGAVTGAAWYAVAYRVVNFAAINLGHARNASAPATGSASIATPNNGAST